MVDDHKTKKMRKRIEDVYKIASNMITEQNNVKRKKKMDEKNEHDMAQLA